MTEEEKKRPEEWFSNVIYGQHPSLRKLSPLEKQFLLAVEHGDISRVARIQHMVNRNPSLPLDMNCKDPVGRSAILLAIDNENLEMLEYLLESGAESRDGLLHAINAEYVEAVDLLLEHEEVVHKDGEKHSWEKVDRDISTFTPEITPLILAAHKDNYEILKILLDRGASLPMPHDVRCCCNDCVQALKEDCLCHSQSRINAYRALSSPSLICLSSIDPILTAFELSWELRRLSNAENEFKEDYVKLRSRCQDFATHLLDHARSSRELEMVLNYDPTHPHYQHGDHMPLARLQMALKYKQKAFIAHPNVQQLLSTLWYDGLPGFRRQNPLYQLWDIIKIGVLFPYYSLLHMLLPYSNQGKMVGKPFVKFIIHSFSYLFFLFLLILASQRVETLVVQWFGTEEMRINSIEAMKMQRGQPPSIIETCILLYIIAHIWQETRELWTKGLVNYFHNLWNIIDFTRNSLYVGTVIMRLLAYFQAQSEISDDPLSVYIPREAWNAYDPMLIADGLFAAGNVFAALKLVHIFSINPYLGPLQISLGRMVIDIIKFFFIYALVLFAFACGLNQLLWYYSDMERQQCYSGPGGTENWVQQRDSCLAWRRFSNLFESSQTLFWASFGLVDISNFDLSGIKTYTRVWGLLMFGSYSVINVVVLLNLLIAMMSNSYNIISERADMEWKFARTTLYMNYFEAGSTVPPPFNVFPAIKHIMKLFGKKKSHIDMSIRRKETKIKERDSLYQSVMCNLVWRYVTAQQKLNENHAVTEDNINELRQDVYSFRHDLMRVLRGNGMKTQDAEKENVDVSGKRVQVRKRRLIKDFSIGLMEVCTEEAAPEVISNKSMLARLVRLSGGETRGSQRWRDLIQAVRRSKTVGNNEGNRFGTIKKKESRDAEVKELEKLPENSSLEFQKNEKQMSDAFKENQLYPNNLEEKPMKPTPVNLYPITSEESPFNAVPSNSYPNILGDLSNVDHNDNVPAVMSPKQKKFAIVSEKLETTRASENSLQEKITRLSKAIPPPIPKRIEVTAIPTVKLGPPPQNERKISDQKKDDAEKANAKQEIDSICYVKPLMSASRLNTPQHQVDGSKKVTSEKQSSKDTAIIVTSSPEKRSLRSESLVSVEVINQVANSAELIDFNDREELNFRMAANEGKNADGEKEDKLHNSETPNMPSMKTNFSAFGLEKSQNAELVIKGESLDNEINTNNSKVSSSVELTSSSHPGWI